MKKYFALALLCMFFLIGCSAGKTDENSYTVDSVLERCGLAGCDEFSEDGNTWNYQRTDEKNNVCLVIMNEESDYYLYSFYIFDSEKKAEEELADYKEDWFKEKEYEEGDDWANGWEAGLMDASHKVFIYRSHNLIVKVYDENLGADMFADEEWTAEYYSEEATEARKKAAEEEHAKIMNEW